MANILVVGKFYPPCRGGTEANTRDVCEALAKAHTVTAWVFNHEPGSRNEMQGGVHVVRCAVTVSAKSQPISFQLWRDLNLDGVDLVLFHAPNFFSAALLLFRLRGVRRPPPIIVTHHSDVFGRKLFRRMLMPLYHRLVRRADWVVVTSLKNAAISADIPEGARIAVVPLGIRIEQYAISEQLRTGAGAWRRSLCGNAPTIAFIGRHARYKGLDILVSALAALPDAHALIVGDGPFRQGAEQLAARLGVAARAHFLGDIDDVAKLRVLACADVFAFPSTEVTEAFGISQLEAMAAGVAVVATDLPTGVTDVAVDEQTALVVPPGDAGALAQAIGRLLDDPALRRRLSDQASRHLDLKFSMTVTLDQFCQLVNSTLFRRSYVSKSKPK